MTVNHVEIELPDADTPGTIDQAQMQQVVDTLAALLFQLFGEEGRKVSVACVMQRDGHASTTVSNIPDQERRQKMLFTAAVCVTPAHAVGRAKARKAQVN